MSEQNTNTMDSKVLNGVNVETPKNETVNANNVVNESKKVERLVNITVSIYYTKIAKKEKAKISVLKELLTIDANRSQFHILGKLNNFASVLQDVYVKQQIELGKPVRKVYFFEATVNGITYNSEHMLLDSAKIDAGDLKMNMKDIKGLNEDESTRYVLKHQKNLLQVADRTITRRSNAAIVGTSYDDELIINNMDSIIVTND